MTGTIKTLKENGFGFIASSEMGKDLFFHRNSLIGAEFESLREGDNVSFDVEESPKGLNAVNVQVV
jgi:CspA family cold shock protein